LEHGPIPGQITVEKERIMPFGIITKTLPMLVSLLALLLTATGVLAHDHRLVGGYNFVVGFAVEPAYEGLANGVEIRVTKVGQEGAGHSHGADSDQGHSGPMAMGQGGPAMDVEGQGSLFVSPGLDPAETFDLDIGHDWEGLTIPYHNHLNHDMTGTISVDHHAELSGRAAVEIHDTMYMPAEISVRPGTIITWTNRSSLPQNLTSGLAPMEDHADGEAVEHPVEGLEETLKVEITHVPTTKSKVLDLRAVAGSPGHYTADLIPTAQGVFEMRVFGSLEENDIDETFVSYGGGGGFSDVLPASDLHFPEQLPEVREIEGAVRGALATAQQAHDAARSAQGASANGGNSSANMLGIIGIVLGAVGFVAGAGGLTMAMRNR
jgi:hypothetical protein